MLSGPDHNNGSMTTRITVEVICHVQNCISWVTKPESYE